MTTELLAAGWRFHQAGDLPRAEDAYRRLLQQEPGNAQAWYLLGALCQARGDLAAAADHLERALRLRPTFAEALQHRGIVHAQQGQLAEAVARFRAALLLKPGDAEIQTNLGLTLARQGQHPEAIALLQAVLRQRPDYVRAQTHLRTFAQQAFAEGVAYLGQGKHDEAAARFRLALSGQPSFAEAHYQLGNALACQEQFDEASACYQQALQLRPDFVEAHHNLAAVLRRQKRFADAEASLRAALRLQPDLAELHNDLAEILLDQRRPTEAMACCQRAIQLDPGRAEAHNQLGRVLWHLHRLDEAEPRHTQAVRLDPHYAEAYLDLGNVLKDQGRLDDAIAAYRAAVRLRPNVPYVHSNLLYVLPHHPDHDAQSVLAEARRWNERHAEPLARFIQPHANDRAGDRRLRIGYVSPDFRAHPVGRFLLPLLEAHDHARFEIFCYASQNVTDAVTDRCRSSADAWRPIFGRPDAQVAQLIREDRIDVLVDLTMHMAGTRLLVFARKPAPVQVTYLAYCGTTGLRTIDYRLTDPYLDPLDSAESCYAEQSVRLPETYWCYQPVAGTPPVNRLPALEAGHVTFGCLNNFCKVTAPTLTAWSQLLRALPETRLLLHAHPGRHCDRVRDFFHQQGIDPDWISFVPQMPTAEYLHVYERLDVALDPFPYGGGTTTCDALWMGVPVVSLAGQTAVGRGGLSILSNVGLADLVARDGEQYVRIAVDLARDRERLSALRAGLRARMQASPLMDGPRFARAVEAAYRGMWQAWCASEPRTPCS
jgi:predicted O-linked N-acetylglucosamine transferase (SPINDLY family)